MSGDRSEHADAQAREPRIGPRHVREHLERERALLHRPRHRARRGRRPGASGKQPSIGTSPWLGLKPAVPQANEGMRIEPPVSVPMLSGGEPRGERGGAAAGRAAGDVPGLPGIADGPVEGVLARDAPGELVQVRLADDHGAGVDDPLHRARGARRHVVAEQRRAVGRAHARGVEQVLGRERNAGERAQAALPGQRARVRERALAVDRDERVELGPRLDAVEVVRDDLLGRDLAGAHALAIS